MSEAQVAGIDLNTQPPGSVPVTGEMPTGVDPIRSTHNLNLRAPTPRGYGTMEGIGDEGLIVEFFKDPVDEKDYVKVSVPGERSSEYVFLATEGRPPYTERFAAQWDAYKNAESQYAGQTLLRDVPWLNDAMRAHLATFRIMTVEQLASVNDTGLQSLGGNVRRLREKAIQAVQMKHANAEGSALLAKIEALTEEIAHLKNERQSAVQMEKMPADPQAEREEPLPAEME